MKADEALKSIESAMSCGFDNFDQIRRDKNLEAMRKSPNFQVSEHAVCRQRC